MCVEKRLARLVSTGALFRPTSASENSVDEVELLQYCATVVRIVREVARVVSRGSSRRMTHNVDWPVRQKGCTMNALKVSRCLSNMVMVESKALHQYHHQLDS